MKKRKRERIVKRTKYVQEVIDIGRKLVAEYTANGPDSLKKMTLGEASLLLAEKTCHLNEVSQRCHKGEGLHVNVPLKRILENDVREIGVFVKGMNADRGKDMEMER